MESIGVRLPELRPGISSPALPEATRRIKVGFTTNYQRPDRVHGDNDDVVDDGNLTLVVQ